jgi:hypothetical protein
VRNPKARGRAQVAGDDVREARRAGDLGGGQGQPGEADERQQRQMQPPDALLPRGDRQDPRRHDEG